jgi:hypothetical protein
VILTISDLVVRTREDYSNSAYAHVHVDSAASQLTIDDIHNAILLQIPRLKNVARGKIVLLGRAEIALRRRYGEMPAFVFVQDPTEHRWGVVVGPIRIYYTTRPMSISTYQHM